MQQITSPRFSITKKEAIKSAIDGLLIASFYALPEMLDQLSLIDFGEYTSQVSLALALFAPLVKRYFRDLKDTSDQSLPTDILVDKNA